MKHHIFLCFVVKGSILLQSLKKCSSFAPVSTLNVPSVLQKEVRRPSGNLEAVNILTDLSMDDLIYKAQSTASTLADSTMRSPSSATSASSLAVLYFAGLLTSFSPCSLGILPLTISYISNAAGEREDKAVFLPTVAFAFGLAAVFCGLGLSVSLLGGVFGSSAGDDFLGGLILALLSSGISIAMGFQLLELVNLPLPSLEFSEFSSSIQTSPITSDSSLSSEIEIDDDGNIIMKETSEDIPTNPNSSGSASGALFRTFLLGGSSALVASPCATPVLTSILAFVATDRDPALGAILLLTYTIGYSTPLLVVGASGGQALANARAASLADEDSFLAKVGSFVNPITASILIWYGTNGLLVALFGDPSLAGLAPILE